MHSCYHLISMDQFLSGNIFVGVFLPIIIGLVMFVMGLSLTILDFKRLRESPKAVFVGILAQIIGAPLVAFLLANLFGLDPILSVSLMLLSAVPGGPMSNVLSFIADGDVALSISLTALNSIITVFTIPIIVNLSALYFTNTNYSLHLPFWQTVIQITLITLLPIAIGMFTKNRFPVFAHRISKVSKLVTPVLLVGIVFTAIILERSFFVEFAKQAILVVTALAVLMFGLGHGLGMLFRLGKKQRTSIGVEVGLQNGALAISIAMSPFLLNTPEAAIVPSVYSFVMGVVVVGYIYLTTRGSSKEHQRKNNIFLAVFASAVTTMLILIFVL
jgi:BASS family bile acid:Na+ symporter